MGENGTRFLNKRPDKNKLMRKICILTLFLSTALPFIWPAAGTTLFSSVGIDITYFTAGSYLDPATANAGAVDPTSARSQSSPDSPEHARRNEDRRHFESVCWTTVGLFIMLAVIWPPAGIAWQRFRKAALAFVVLTLVLSLCGWWLREHFASPRELAALVLGFSACATLGMPFTATLAEKLCAAHKPLGLFAPAIISGIIGAGLGMILFMAGMFLVIYHTNSQYLNFLGI
jgi:hypothetical protein